MRVNRTVMIVAFAAFASAGCRHGGSEGDADVDADIDVDDDFDADADGDDACVAATCAPEDCGELPDGCGGTIECGACTDPSCAIDVAAGARHSCVVNRHGNVLCWGANDRGQLGDGTMVDAAEARLTLGVSGAREVVAGEAHTCALLDDGQVLCWGDDSRGQLTIAGLDASAEPRAAAVFPDVVDLDASWDHACAVRDDGTTWCWGGNDSGELGPAGTSVFIPEEIGTTDAVEVATGLDFACVRDGSGGVLCWGDNSSSQLGDDTTVDRPTPAPVVDLERVVEIGAGARHACARQDGGSVACWGDVYGFGIGFGRPVVVIASDAVGLAVMDFSTCVTMSSGDVQCFGPNASGALGVASPAFFDTPTTIDALVGMVDVDGATGHACGATPAALWCWGDNARGQLTGAPAPGPLPPREVAFECNPGCVPLTCALYGASCGDPEDGCGASLACGECTEPDTCGGGGLPYHCGHPCVPLTCSEAELGCGPAYDGCGETIECGMCASPYSCGGGDVANQCGCDRAWSDAEVVGTENTVQRTIMELDDLGNVHVGWFDLQGIALLGLRYGRREPSGAWVVETIVSDVEDGEIGDMAVERSGRAHFTWRQGALQYARRDTDGTSTVEVVTGGWNGDSAVAVDPTGTVHVVFEDWDSRVLGHAERSVGGSWTTMTVPDAGESAGRDCDLAIDAEGGLHVAYGYEADFDGLSDGVLYAYRSPAGVWSVTDLGASRYGNQNSVAVDPAGGVHIVSSSRGHDLAPTLTHFYRPFGGAFVQRPIETSELPAGVVMSDLELDPAGGAHVVFESNSEDPSHPGMYTTFTRYGHWPGTGDWQISGAGGGDAPVAIAVNDAHQVHVAQTVSAELTRDTVEHVVGACP